MHAIGKICGLCGQSVVSNDTISDVFTSSVSISVAKQFIEQRMVQFFGHFDTLMTDSLIYESIIFQLLQKMFASFL